MRQSPLLPLMKEAIKKHLDTILLVLLPLGACVYLWLKSGPPPYGYPLGELSDHYWGIVIDIARKWRSGEFGFWDRSIGGGFCLYSSGFYPLWVPGNVLALVLHYDQFYLFKLIEPHVIGIFCAFLLLRFGLKLNTAWSCYGALVYVGFVFTRYVGILHHPFFLWACGLFPLLVYFYNKFSARSISFRAAVLGAFMALIFLGGGAGQFAQLVIWSLILLTLDAFYFNPTKEFPDNLKRWLTACAVFLFFAFVLAAVQLLPTVFYTLFESNRTLGEYSINNFPIFKNDYKESSSISNIFYQSFFFGGRLGVRAFWAVMIFAIGKLIMDWKAVVSWWSANKAMKNVVLTTVLFFLLPATAQFAANILPFLGPVFKPLRMFTFGYCGFMIDLLLVLFLVVTFSVHPSSPRNFVRATPDSGSRSRGDQRDLVLLFFLVLAEIYLFLPFWINQPTIAPWLRPAVQNYQMIDTQVSFTDRSVTMIVLGLLAFPFFQRTKWRDLILFPCFLFLGSQLLFSSYICGAKGQRPSDQYYFETPEHSFYRKMKGHYYMAYVDGQGTSHRYDTMTHNYDLLFGVHGVNGFLNIPPKRFNDFTNAYHKEIYWNKNKTDYKYSFGATPAALTTHFPVEFTTVKKGTALPWPLFQKAVSGAEYDVWLRQGPAPRVKFAGQLKVVPFRELIDSFDRPFNGVVYMTQADFSKFQPQVGSLSDPRQARYKNFQQLRSDHWSFDVESAGPVLVLLPEMFQEGWRLKIDGKPARVFPANYIFIGFPLPAGNHHIELVYRPVLWEAGIVINLLGVALFLGLMGFYPGQRKRARP